MTATPRALQVRLLLTASVMMSVGCSSEDIPRPTLSAQDTVVVEADGAASRIRLEELARAPAGGAQFSVGEVGGFVPLGDGSVVYWDRYHNELRLIGSAGIGIRVLAGEGQGPGEYEEVYTIRRTGSGQLVIWDPGQSRVSVLSPTGDFVDSFRVRSGIHEGAHFSLWTDSTVTVLAMDPDREWGSPGVGDRPYRLLEYDFLGDVISSTPLPRDERSHQAMHFGRYENFTTRTLVASGKGGRIAVGRNSDYQIDILGLGRLLRVRRPWRPIPLTAGEMESWQAALRPFREMTGEDFVVPSTKPAFRRLLLDDSGRLWVERYMPFEPPGSQCLGSSPPLCWLEPVVYDVFGTDGAFRGSVHLPWRAEIVHVGSDELWLVERGDWDEQEIVRYRMLADAPD